MLSQQAPLPDPVALALRRKARSGAPGAAEARAVAAGDGWRVVDILCTHGGSDRAYEERYASSSVSLVLSGAFLYRSDQGATLMSPGALLLGNARQIFECSHPYGAGDRCLSFQFDADLFERLAHDAGASAGFEQQRLLPLRALTPLATRAQLALEGADSFEEIALELAGSAIELAGRARRTRSGHTLRNGARVARILRELESCVTERHTLADLAKRAGLSRFHFLRSFKDTTGVTPHQWLLRARLRYAAHHLVTTNDSVTEIAFAAGFGDHSNFTRTFRAEFGVSPGRYARARSGAPSGRRREDSTR